MVTTKLYTSDLTDKQPPLLYSGAINPLENGDRIIITELVSRRHYSKVKKKSHTLLNAVSP